MHLLSSLGIQFARVDIPNDSGNWAAELVFLAKSRLVGVEYTSRFIRRMQQISYFVWTERFASYVMGIVRFSSFFIIQKFWNSNVQRNYTGFFHHIFFLWHEILWRPLKGKSSQSILMLWLTQNSLAIRNIK